MEIFACVCLIIIFLVIQYLINKVIEMIFKDFEDSIWYIIPLIFGIIFNIAIGKYIILWTYPLITN